MVNELTQIYYLHRGDNMPFYIGKTINFHKNVRLNNHKITFGEGILLEEIDLVKTIEWEFWEKYYISLFKSWGFKLKNKNNGGGGCITHEVSKETRKKISITHKGLKKPFSKSHKKNHKKSYKDRKVTWGEKISKGLKGRKNTWGGGGRKGRKVLQYDLNNNFIKEWDNIEEPSKFYKGYIGGCLNGRQKTAGGFIWKYG